MRRLAILAIVAGCVAAGAANAATAARPAVSPARTSARTDNALNQAAFLPSVSGRAADPISNILDRDSYAPGAGLVRWDTREARLSGAAEGPVDSLRIRQGDLYAGPGDLPLSQRSDIAGRSYEVSVMRNWPGAFSFDAGRMSVDLTPHAGVGVIGGDGASGSSAEAGATIQLSKADLASQRLQAMGVRDGASFGQQGRWYLFAAASGRAVGLNMLHGDAGWNRAGWSTDPTSKLVGDTQVGVGWRRGAIQTSVGYVHREVKGQHLMYGVDPKSDSMVAFSLSIRPRK